ncbi:MAG TPA: choice-of-anchor tandem repeat GloVer-containing protein [Thermoanaerobaculia bacterium]|nr:choice-of-anchor tandem repeat GloVer-containing protein [Thermoanaerobaculia bacterium]
MAVIVFAIALTLPGRAAFGQIYKTVYDFGGSPDGAEPRAALLHASDGNFYGTTCEGGFPGPLLGTVFRMDALHDVSVLYKFADAGDGGCPVAPLIESRGYLWGTSLALTGPSVLFRTDFVGDLGVAATFGLCCPRPPGLTAVSSDLYGMAPSILGEPFDGFIYVLDSLGNFTVLHNFSGPDGADPSGELTLGSDGNLYGVTRGGGSHGFGTVFLADGVGNVTVLHAFAAFGDGSYPSGRLIESAGYLYGTTEEGGTSGLGTVFRVNISTSPGLVEILHSFGATPNDGTDPSGSLVSLGGLFYGTTLTGGQFSGGTLFQIDSSGSTTILHNFGGAFDGIGPEPLVAVPRPAFCILCSDRLYGTTNAGGLSGHGTIYLFDFSPFAVIHLQPIAGPVRVAPGDPVQIRGEGFSTGQPVSVMIGGLAATRVEVLDPETINAFTPVDLQPGTLNDVTVTSPTGLAQTFEHAWLADFLDVPEDDPLHDFVARVFRAGLMDGCGAGNFCEGESIDRGTFVTTALKAIHGPAWPPPACTAEFRDVPCPGPQADWIEAAVAEGIAQPCARNRFCPNRELTRETAPELLLKTEHGADYVAPPCTGVFKDVRCPSSHADAIEQIYREGVVEACSANPLRYCPNRRVERGPMAEYAAKAFQVP